MLLLNLMSTVVPDVPINRGVSAATTGILLLDVLPLLTTLPALSILRVHAHARRWGDVAAFGLGFALATIYHVAHMMPGGIGAATLLGVPGTTWRTLDILWAQALLARALGHVLGVRSRPLALLLNAGFPALVLGAGRWRGGITLGTASQLLALVMLCALGLKLALEGSASLPRFGAARGKAAVVCVVLGLTCFPLPELFPQLYWLFHSLWHLFMAAGMVEIYLQLFPVEGMKPPIWLPQALVTLH